MTIYRKISAPGKKLALLIDPDKTNTQSILATVYAADESGVNLILIGGSLVSEQLDNLIEIIKDNTKIPVVIFPGSLMQLSNKADAILLLSLVSGRNPEFLIGNHVLAAPFLSKGNIEVISTGYILVDGGNTTSVEYISNTKPIPANKTDIIVATAQAAELIGHKLIYLEAGSGAPNNISVDTIKEVKRNINIPLIVGGGITTNDKLKEAFRAGADIVVVGTAIEKRIDLLNDFSKTMNSFTV